MMYHLEISFLDFAIFVNLVGLIICIEWFCYKWWWKRHMKTYSMFFKRRFRPEKNCFSITDPKSPFKCLVIVCLFQASSWIDMHFLIVATINSQSHLPVKNLVPLSFSFFEVNRSLDLSQRSECNHCKTYICVNLSEEALHDSQGLQRNLQWRPFH